MKKLVCAFLLCAASMSYAGVDEGKSVPQVDSEAVNWFLKAAEQGDTSAQFSLGMLYYEGRGVSQDYSKAASWYLKAAEQGHQSAQYNLGVMYTIGRSVPQDFKTAYILFSLAANKGDDNAVKAVDMILKQLTPTAKVDAERISTQLYNSKNFAADLRKLLNAQ